MTELSSGPRDIASDVQLTKQDGAGHEAKQPTNALQYGGMNVELGPNSKRREFQYGATGLVGVRITGLWIESRRPIDALENGKGTTGVSKYGDGTYIGSGALEGDQIRLLRSEPHYHHELEFRGNVLVLPYVDQEDAAYEIVEKLLGDNLEALKSSEPGHMVNQMLRLGAIEGVEYDAFALYTAPEDQPQMAEMVVLRPEETITIIDRRHVTPGQSS